MRYVGSRFGQDTQSRITTSTDLLLEASEMPAEPRYQTLVPFVPDSSTSSTTTATSDLEADWKEYPDRLDLHVYQGDDVQIPLYFKNAAQPLLDMSSWDWKAQARIRHRYYSHLVTEFTINAALVEPTPPDTVNATLVTLFLPRMKNRFAGVWSWDLYSTSPYVGPVFPQPADVNAEDWPMTDQIKTWLYGYLYVVPRLTETDWLPLPANALPTGPITVTPQGYTVGPNGRVP